ncbi:YybH family protein [Flagellimonas okinawensis]|uniref:Nuclear transport factor 2 family protein n=1 Tax=Flagellimonas okinawensis TaxID=3031324 RepID=A0ABT5XRE4_9FLAO|nr:nuclear transport factor 2 family protein [[Muricauda] okinawensis]MDF0708473.1 nuclear transport factor 2 family protein [[Muricauda] okinawensis]
MKYILTSIFFLGIILCSSCKDKAPKNTEIEQHTEAFVGIMEKHLNAVTNRDLPTLQSTMHPGGKMQLILPGMEIIHGVDGFMEYHKDWFSDENWTFDTKILNTDVGEQFGMAITEIVYREPERDGAPYFNRMIVSYVLEHVNGNWYIIKDHASSIEKSTDQQ